MTPDASAMEERKREEGEGSAEGGMWVDEEIGRKQGGWEGR